MISLTDLLKNPFDCDRSYSSALRAALPGHDSNTIKAAEEACLATVGLLRTAAEYPHENDPILNNAKAAYPGMFRELRAMVKRAQRQQLNLAISLAKTYPKSNDLAAALETAWTEKYPEED